MTTTQDIESQALGQQGEPCGDCGSPLAADQRYCLSCGARRGGPRVPFEATASPTAPPPEDRGPVGPGREWTPLTAIGLVAVIALILVSGVLIGRGGGDSGKPQVVSVGGGGGGGAATDQAGGASVQKAAAFKNDWPSGKNGYTVELGVLKKDGTSPEQVKSAKDDARGKGAKKVGVLDSDEYKSLPGGQYVLFSGVYAGKASASKALGALRGKFPGAKVIKVSATAGEAGGGATSADTGGKGDAKVSRQQLQKLNSLSGDEYVKRSKKLPDTTGVAGKAPPKDNGTAGGGGPALEIK